MERPEFVALQVTVLVRNNPARSQDAQLFLDSPELRAALRENLVNFIKDSFVEYKIPFEEVIISVDKPAVRAQPIETPPASPGKSSFFGRLFGRE